MSSILISCESKLEMDSSTQSDWKELKLGAGIEPVWKMRSWPAFTGAEIPTFCCNWLLKKKSCVQIKYRSCGVTNFRVPEIDSMVPGEVRTPKLQFEGGTVLFIEHRRRCSGIFIGTLPGMSSSGRCPAWFIGTLPGMVIGTLPGMVIGGAARHGFIGTLPGMLALTSLTPEGAVVRRAATEKRRWWRAME